MFVKLKYLCFFFIGFCIHFPTFAQQEAALNQKFDSLMFDTAYVHSYYSRLGLRVYEITKLNQIQFRNNKTGRSVTYKPNDVNAIGLGFNYRWMSLGLTLPLPSLDEKIYGKTNNIDLQLNIYTRRFTIDGSMLYHKGFYMSNIKDIVHDWKQKEFPYRADMQNMSIALGAIYSVNYRKFSYRAAFVQNEWQKKSAGSLLLGAFAMLYRMRADSSFVPRTLLKLSVKGMDSTSFASMFNLGVSVGYGHTFVFKKHWYVNASMVPGLALQIFSSRDQDNRQIVKPSVRMGSRLMGRFAFGVNKERYFAGVQSVFDTYILMNSKLTSFQYMYGHVRVFYGRRFDLKKKKTRY